MNAHFKVLDGFDLPSRRAWVLRGDVVAGSVRPGMFLSFPFNDSVTMSAEIGAVEAVDGPGQASAIGLLLEYEDDLGLELWRGLTSPGEVLEVTDHDPAA